MVMTSKKEKEFKKEIDKALKHEENLQHDENEKPITFAKDVKNGK